MNAAIFQDKMRDLASITSIDEAVSAGIVVTEYSPAPTHDGRRGFFIPYEKVFPVANALRKMGYEVVVCPRTGRHVALPTTSDERALCERNEIVDPRFGEILRTLLANKDAIIAAMRIINVQRPTFEPTYSDDTLGVPKDLLVFVTQMYPSYMPLDLVEAAQTRIAKIGALLGDGGMDGFRKLFYDLAKNSIYEFDSGGISVIMHRISVPAGANAEFGVDPLAEDSQFVRVTYKQK